MTANPIVIDSVTTGSSAVFNLNGGTLRAGAAGLNLLGTATGTLVPTVTTSSAASTIDANSFATTISAPIVNGATAGGLTITDSSAAGGGSVTLSGANTYTGPTTVNAGTLQAGVASVANVSGAFGNNSAMTLANVAGATLALNNFNTQIGSLTGGGTTGGNVTLGTATLTIGGDNTSPAAFSGVISGGTGGGVTKIGSGTLTLGGANTYTGATSVTAGTLSLTGSLGSTAITTSGAGVFSESSTGSIGGTASFTQGSTGTSVLGGVNTYTGATTVNVGTLSLTGSLNSASALTLGAGTFAYAAPSGTGTQTVTGVTLTTGTFSGLGTTVAGDTLNLGAITRQAGSGVNFTLTGTVTTTTANTNGILGGYATVGGTSWAVGATTAGTATAITALTNYTTTSAAGTTAANYAGGNIDVNSSVAPAAAITSNTLRFNTAATAETLTLTGTNSLASGGILMTPNAGASANIITGGILNSGGSELILNNYDTTSGGLLTIASQVGSSSSFGVTVGGGGTTTLSGPLSYSGTTIVSGGTLNLTGTGTIGSINSSLGGGTVSTINFASTGTINTGSINVGGGSFTSSGVINQTAGTVTTSNLSLGDNSSAYGAYNLSGGLLSNTTIRIGGYNAGGGATGNGNGAFIQTGGAVNLNGNNIFIGRAGAGNNLFYLNGGTFMTGTSKLLGIGYLGSSTDVATISAGTFTTGSVAFNDDGGTGNTNFTGTAILNLNGGTLSTGSITNFNPASGMTLVNFNGGTLQANASASPFFSGATNAFVYTGGAKIDTNGQTITIAQPLLTTAGTTGVSAVAVSNAGSGYVSAPIVSITGGGGTGATAVATLSSSGQVSGITITSPGTGYTSAPTVTLIGGGGTGATLGTVTDAANGTTDGGLAKIGTGTLTLSGANTFNGATTVGAGTLDLANALALQNSTLTTSSSGGATTFDSTVTGNAFTFGGLAGSGNLTLANNATTPAAIALTAGGNNAPTIYSGVLSGSGSLTKTGTGTLTLSGFSTYTGGTTVSGIGSTLALNAGGTGVGTVQGVVTVGPGAILSLTAVDALGYTSGSQVTALNVNGGTVDDATNGSEGFLTSFNLTGSTMKSSGGGFYNIYPNGTGTPGIITNASTTTSTISGGLDIRGGALNVAVASGTTPSGVDLLISGVINDTGAAGNGALTKTGSGYLNLTGQNTFAGPVTVSGGTLNIGVAAASNGSNGALGLSNNGKTITVGTGATLSGTVNNWFGNQGNTDANLPAITVTGGTLSTIRYTTLGALSLSGATVTAASTDTGNYQAFALRGNVSVSGTAPSTITSTNIGTSQGGYHLGANTTFTVASTGTAGTPDLTVSAPLINQSGDFGNAAGGLTKAGAGSMALTAINSYTGPTAVTAGTLLVTGSTAGGSAVTVNNSGTILGGTGTVAGTVSVGNGATISAGNSVQSLVGKLTTGALTLATGSTFNALLASSTSFSTLSASGTTALGGAAFSISTTPGAAFTNGQVLELITSPVSGNFTNTTFTAGGYNFAADYATNSGFFDVDITAVPEPATWLAGFLLLGTLGVSQRRKFAGWLSLPRA